MIATLALALSTLSFGPAQNSELVYIDNQATLRWKANGQEVALFGANYCLPSALDYRAAGYVGADRKALIRQDMAHFARMGWDALRFSFWGDWESSDRDGNLKPNDHLDLLDYTLAEGEKRGIKFLLSPIVTYDARWPEMKEYPEAHGFARYHEKGKLGTDAESIKVQQNYLRQLLNHVNPYTGRALKDEPSILFVETINEPWHHANDRESSIRYIDALVSAIRETGCQKPTFHNLSQDFRMAGPINDSKVDGATYAWYPTGLNANHELFGNFLRYVDDYPPMRRPEVHKKPVIVYEFDLPDATTAYGFPAMTREFRKTGAQFAAMFSYDMLATAPTNLGWTTHLLNLVYTPKKAVGGILAGEAMRRLPRFQDYGKYPASQRFGDFRVSGLADYAELNAKDAFVYSGDTGAKPRDLSALRKIVGLGSSPVVRYPGKGIYFLDRIDEGRWRLEVYPDALQVDDPYRDPKKEDLKFRLVWGKWPMRVRLPDLGDRFAIQGLNSGNALRGTAKAGEFTVSPGVYLLSSKPESRLPERIGEVPMREFVCPPAMGGPAQVTLDVPPVVRAGERPTVRAQIASDLPAKTVTLKTGKSSVRMRPVAPYLWEAAAALPAGVSRLAVTADGTVSKEVIVNAIAEGAPLPIFDPVRDAANLSISRSGESKIGAESLVAGSAPDRKAFPLRVPDWLRNAPEEIRASLYIGNLAPALKSGRQIEVRLRARDGATAMPITLVDRDGNAWTADIPTSPEWKTATLPLNTFKPSRWALLPQAYPGTWQYWADSAPGAKLRPENLERLQFAIQRRADGTLKGVEVEGVSVR